MSERGSDVAVALAGLLRVCEPPSTVLSLFVHKAGAVGAWEAVLARRAPRAVLSATAARTANVAAAVLVSLAEQDVAMAAKCGARVIGETDGEWPLDAVSAFSGAVVRGVRGAGPPFALYVRGRGLTGLPGWGVTMVGSRASSAYGQRVAGEMAHELASRGMSIISGAAFGIDTAVHRAALQVVRSGSVGGGVPAGLPATVAVLACGIDRAYPVANRELLEAIAGCGSVVSEYPPGATPARHRFLVRNRLIAAFGAGTVVVEAGRRSGTLSTAAAAEQLGRLVMAVPGPVTSAMSVGCHLLLADRFAQLVTNAGDVLAALGRAGSGRSGAVESVPGADPRHPTDGLDLITARVYDALPTHETASLEELVTESGLLANEVLGSLAVLEVHGMSTREGTLWRRVTHGRRHETDIATFG